MVRISDNTGTSALILSAKGKLFSILFVLPAGSVEFLPDFLYGLEHLFG